LTSGEPKDEEIGGFRLLRRIGEGGAAEVFLATPVSATPFAESGMPVALKRYRPTVLQDKAQRERIRREFQVGSTLRHPNLVPIYAFDDGSRDTPAHLVMEYVDGLPLDRWIQMFEPLPGRLVLKVTQQLVEAIGALHNGGITHRDIKPQNIMISSNFEIKLMDYGVVRITQDSPITDRDKFLGTIRNASPEYLQGSDYDTRTDLYSLGTVIYALLHGKQVFSDENQFARLIQKVVTTEPEFDQSITLRDDSKSPHLLSIARKLLTKNPANRPSLEDVRRNLEELAPAGSDGLSDPIHGYVATALTGLSDDAAASITWVSHQIAQIAKQYDVYVYQPRRATDPVLHPEVQPSAVYVLDRKRVSSADVLLLLADKPSFGAGQEIEIAASYNKPTVIIAREDVPISRMLLGSFANLLEVIRYQKPEDLELKVRKLFARFLPRIRNARQLARRSSAIQVGGRLKEMRLAKGYKSVEEMAEAIGMSSDIIAHLESGDLDNPGIRLLSYIARGLDCALADVISYGVVEPIGGTSNPSLQALERTARDAGWSASDYLDLRDDFLRQVAASGEPMSLGDEEWLSRHTTLEKRRLRGQRARTETGDEQQRLL
jgi:serine/threonine protein kinase/transcriptional regulator with XRE-family HTH domain